MHKCTYASFGEGSSKKVDQSQRPPVSLQVCVDEIARMATENSNVVLVKTPVEFIGKQNVKQFGVIVRKERDKV